LAYWRIHQEQDSEQRILCLYNLSNQQQSISLDLGYFQGYLMTDLLAGDAEITLTNWPLVKVLSAYSSHWLRLDEVS
jgi:hypothetical protein